MTFVRMTTEKDFEKIADAIGKAIKLKAKELAPFGQTGELNRRINYRIEGDKIVIFCDVEYADELEYGKPPEPLSRVEKEGIMDWARWKGLTPGQGKGVVRKIERKGIEVGTMKTTQDNKSISSPAALSPAHITSLDRDSWRPFLRPAIHQVMTPLNMQRIIEGALK